MRWPKRILIALGALLVLVAGLAFFLLGTAPGGKLALDVVVLPRLPVDVRVDDLSGRLWGRFELAGIDVRLDGVEARAERMAVRFRPWALLGKHVDVERVELEGVDVRVFEPAPDSAQDIRTSDTPEEAPGDSLPPLADLPLAVTFDSVFVRRISATVYDSIALTSGRATLTGSLDEYSVAFEGTAAEPLVGDVGVQLTAAGTPDRLDLERLSVTTLEGVIHGSGRVSWWPHLSWQADVRGEDLKLAALMEDPEQWPGAFFVAAEVAGSIDPESGLRIEATVDTVGGELRGPFAGSPRFHQTRMHRFDIGHGEIENRIVTNGSRALRRRQHQPNTVGIEKG